jgi:hypothetical protein
MLSPSAILLVEEQQGASTGRTEVVVEHEILSGYYGQPVEVAPAHVDEVARGLVVGLSVTDAKDEYVGEVTQIDSSNASFVFKGVLVDDAVYHVPFGQVAHINMDDMCVKLLFPRTTL